MQPRRERRDLVGRRVIEFSGGRAYRVKTLCGGKLEKEGTKKTKGGGVLVEET